MIPGSKYLARRCCCAHIWLHLPSFRRTDNTCFHRHPPPRHRETFTIADRQQW